MRREPENGVTPASRIADLSPRDLDLLVQRLRKQGGGTPVLQLRPRHETEPPLSFAQERLWFLWQLDPASPVYNVASAVHLRGSLDTEALERALAAVVARHQVLHTAVASVEGRPVCRMADAGIDWWTVDLAALPEERRGSEADRLARLCGRLAFDLERPPLLRACLLHRDPEDHTLVLVLHHIVADAWSAAILVQELGALYDAFRSGREPLLPALPIQYGDFAAWQREWLTAERLESEIAHWRQALAGLPTLELPTDHPRPAVLSGRGALIPIAPSRPIAEQLAGASRDAGVTPFTMLLAAWAVLLGRYSGQEDFAIGSPVAGRGRAEVEPLIGCFINTLALRADLSGDPPFRTLVDRMWQARTMASSHQEVPFEKLVEHLAPDRSLAHAPLFQVMLAFESEALDPQLSGLAARVERLDTGTSKLDLTLALSQGQDGLSGWIEFSSELFAAATVARMAAHWLELLAAALSQLELPISQLPLLSSSERHQILYELAAPTGAPDLPAEALHELFEAQAAADPERPALVCRDEQLTYRELNRRANCLARRLRQMGVLPEAPVGILLERGPAAVVAILATLKAGGAYLPLDAQYPHQRIALMLDRADVSFLITRRELAAGLPTQSCATVLMDDEGPALPTDDESPGVRVPAEALAYIIYTSGSTGVPKGVALAHRGAVELMAWARDAFAPDEIAEVLATTSFSFDLSVFELFVPLSWGGTVLLVPDALHLETGGARPRLLNTVPSVMAELVRTGAVPASVQTVNLAGEPLPRSLVEQIHARTAARRVLNLYGPTEDTTYSTWGPVEPGTNGPVSLGRSLPGTRVHLIDRRLALVPLGVAGELCLAGTSLARGYVGRPDLTAERFVPDPWSTTPGQRMYRTGDLALRRPDGRLEFLGRIDHQVKIRGFRIELGEIEAALCRHPEIAEAVVVVEESREMRLIAFVVPATPGAQPLDAEEIRNRLRRDLPEPFIPSAIASREAMPRTPNGKLDRRALAEEGASVQPAFVARTAPGTPLEQMLAGIWEQLLGHSNIGREDSFFELGGHSLLAARVTARVREALGVELALQDVFAYSRLQALASRIETQNGAGLGDGIPLERRPTDGEAPLSFAQERLWFLDRLGSGSAIYNMPAVFQVEGPLDAAVLRRALGEVVRRHEVLRAVFRDEGGRPVQSFAAPAPPPFLIEDLSGLPVAEQASVVETRVADQVALPFDLGRGPLLRAVLLTLAEERAVLLLTLHHIVFDGGSSGILLGELCSLYQAFSGGLSVSLPELPLQYADFAAWQRRRLSDEVLDRLLAHWRERLSGAPDLLPLPTDRPRRPAGSRSRGGRLPISFDEERSVLVRTAAHRLGVTPFMVLAAGFASVLSRHSGSRDLLLGFPITDRPFRELEGLIGLFVNTLVLRVDLSGDPPTEQLLHRVRRAALDAYAHRELPFEKLVLELRPRRVLDHAPLVQVLLVYQREETPLAVDIDGLSLVPLPVPLAGAKFDLNWSLTDTGREITGSLDFARDLFDDVTIERLGGHLVHWLDQALVCPDRRLSEIDPLSQAERAQMLEWSQSGVVLGAACTLHALVADQRLATPDAPALVCGGEPLTYAELGRRSDRLLAALGAAGATPGSRVAVCLWRGPEVVAAFLAILRCGAAYVPLDPDYPGERLSFLLEDSAPAVLLTERRMASRLPAPPGRLLLLEEIGEGPVRVAGEGKEAVPESSAAYVIYTSGSTGRPKGVVVPHAAACNRLLWSQEQYPLAPGDRVLQSASLSFDFSIWEIFAPLIAGAVLVMPEPGTREVSDLVRLIAEQGVTVAHFVPSALRALLDSGAVAECASLRLLLSGGEALSADVHDRLLAALPRVTLYNQYGPTETTIDSTFWRCSPGAPGHSVPIGWPISGTRTYLLDSDLQPVPIGASGELCVGGAGLAMGYIERPAATAERFLPDPWSGQPGARMYRTGDLVSHRQDGAIRYLGRLDEQVKIRGFRIEPEEIDTALRLHPGLREAVTVVREDVPGMQRLVSYVVPRPGALPAGDELRAFLGASLPEYMLPAVFVTLPALPLSPAGKLDRRSLPAPGRQRPVLSQGYTPPRNPVEELLAGIWSGLLEVEPVGIEDDFFALGGHSLLAGRLAARIRETFGVDLPLALLFEQPTVAALAAAITRAVGQPPEGPQPGTAPRDGRLPLSFSQQRLWLLQQAFPGSSAYHVPGSVRLTGELRPAALAWSLREIVRRHEVLRTVFPSLDGEPFQQVREEAFALPQICLAALPHERRSEEMRRLAEAEVHRPFSLTEGPLYRALLVRLAPTEHELLLTLHHIVFDGHSLGLLLGELTSLYGAAVRGLPSPLPEPVLQYSDFAVWQRQQMSGETLAGQLRYFRETLEDAPPLIELPTDHPRPPAQSLRGASARSVIDGEAAAALRAACRQHGVTSFMFLLSGFARLLRQWSAQEDLVVGTVVANRDRPELAGLIGCCMNFLPLRLALAGAATGRELLARVRAATLAAYAHQECPFELVVAELNPERDPGYNPIYNVGILLQGFPHRATLDGGVGLEILEQEPWSSLLDLRLVVQEEGGRFSCSLEYATDLLTEQTAESLLAAFGMALASLREQPDEPLDGWLLPDALAAQATTAAERSAPASTLTVVATFTADPLDQPLGFWMEQLGLPFAVEIAPYNQVFQQILDPASRMSCKSSGVNIILVRLEDWSQGALAAEGVERTARELLAALRAASGRTSVPWLVAFCPSAPSARSESLLRIEQWLCKEILEMPGVYTASTTELTDLYPVDDPFDPYSDRAGHIPYTPTMWSALASLLARRVYVLTSPPYKVIALDCDQTLWRGVCGEDGPLGIEIDHGRRALQELMRAQHDDAGMLLCLCSKNNEEDVLAVFEHHPEMPLRLEHFVARRIDWRPKSENLRSLASQLGLGLDSFIFLDDSPVECLEVESACPEVLALTLPTEPDEISPFLKHIWAFDHLKPTTEDRQRTALYRAHLEREELRTQAPTLDEFIAGLQVEVEIRPAVAQDLSRIAQLTQRTNQFNVSTRRRSEAEIAALCAAEGRHCLGVTVRDRFGEYGLVGVVICEPGGPALVVDTFLLSCRVLGRGVEHQVLAHLEEIALAAGAAQVEIPFLPTPKNRPALDFLESLERVVERPGEGGERSFILTAASGRKERVAR